MIRTVQKKTMRRVTKIVNFMKGNYEKAMWINGEDLVRRVWHQGVRELNPGKSQTGENREAER